MSVYRCVGWEGGGLQTIREEWGGGVTLKID